MNNLEKILNTFRISPHGITLMGLSLVLSHQVNNLKVVKELPNLYQDFSSLPSCLIFGLGATYAGNCILKYKRYKNSIEKQGLKEKNFNFAEPYYCDRQAFKAAAYSLNLKEEYKITKEKYKGIKIHTWLPEI